MKFLVLNGPNLNLLGKREPGVYGTGTYAGLCAEIAAYAAARGIRADIRQSNHEGVLIDEIQAAALRVKLPLLGGHNAQRRRIAARYSSAFASLPLRCPPSVGEDYVAHLYVVRTPCRDALRAHLQVQGIASDVHYPIPDHRQNGYSCLQQADNLGVTEAACFSVLSLPCYPGLSDEAVSRVIAAVTSFFEENGC